MTNETSFYKNRITLTDWIQYSAVKRVYRRARRYPSAPVGFLAQIVQTLLHRHVSQFQKSRE